MPFHIGILLREQINSAIGTIGKVKQQNKTSLHRIYLVQTMLSNMCMYCLDSLPEKQHVHSRSPACSWFCAQGSSTRLIPPYATSWVLLPQGMFQTWLAYSNSYKDW